MKHQMPRFHEVLLISEWRTRAKCKRRRRLARDQREWPMRSQTPDVLSLSGDGLNTLPNRTGRNIQDKQADCGASFRSRSSVVAVEREPAGVREPEAREECVESRDPPAEPTESIQALGR